MCCPKTIVSEQLARIDLRRGIAGEKAAAQAARERAVEDAIHSGEMEDLPVSPAFESDAAEYALGAIDIDELKSPVRGGSGARTGAPES